MNGFDVSHIGELRDRFAQLYQAAVRPLYTTVAKHTRLNLEEAGAPAATIDKQWVSSWLSAANPMTPDTFAKLRAFVAALTEKTWTGPPAITGHQGRHGGGRGGRRGTRTAGCRIARRP